MGTNYYVHLGKTVAIGGGVVRLYLAIPRDVLGKLPRTTRIRDEYGAEMTVAEFIEKMTSTPNFETDESQVGVDFS